jgi:hypothetical protein
MTERLRPVDIQTAKARRLELREELAQIPEILNKPPEEWVSAFILNFHRLQRGLDSFAPETQEYLGPALKLARALIKEEQIYTRTHKDDPLLTPLNVDKRVLSGEDLEQHEKAFRHMRGVRADNIIMNFSRIMAEPFGQELIPVDEIFIPIEQIVACNPSCIRLVKERVEDQELNVVYFKHPYINELWQRIPLPFDELTAIKGGGARIVNGVYAGAPDSMIASEIPLNDTDLVRVVSCNTTEELVDVWYAAKILEADNEGVEIKSGDGLDYQDYANSRDMTINMAWITSRGLHTCTQAVEAARSGIAEITGNYRPDKSIYNTDRFTWTDPETGDKMILPKQRGISREVKATVEGKILGFPYEEISANTPLGIYALWLVKRWHKYYDKDHPQYNPQKFGEHLHRMFLLVKKMQHVPTGLDGVMEYLDDVHITFPYFDFRRDIDDMTDVVKWKGKRLAKQLDREYAWATSIPSDYDFIRKPGDTEKKVLTLDGCDQGQEEINFILANYDDFRRRCDNRSDKYYSRNLSPVQKYFFDMDLEPGPDRGDI